MPRAKTGAEKAIRLGSWAGPSPACKMTTGTKRIFDDFGDAGTRQRKHKHENKHKHNNIHKHKANWKAKPNHKHQPQQKT